MTDTVRSKELHELSALEVGTTLKSHQGGNGVYKSAGFKEDIQQRQKTLSLFGVDMHGKTELPR